MTIAILAGGASRRMGADKASLVVAGETLLDRTIRISRAAGARRVLVVGRSGENPAAEFWPDAAGRAGQGPIAGLATALGVAGDEIALLACDMPGLSADALRWLWETAQARETTAPDGLATRASDGRIEPLFAVYAPSCRALLESEDRSLTGLIARGRFAVAIVPDPHLPALHNVNTPEDLAAFRASRG